MSMNQRLRANRHDPLHHLQKSQIAKFAKGDVIYESASPETRLYLVLSGRVQVFHSDNGGQRVLLQIVEPEGFFGETGMWGAAPPLSHTAVAATQTELMSWTSQEVEAQIMREPSLGLALIEELCERCTLLRERIFALSVLPNRARLMVALLQLGDMIGEETETGAIRLRGLTHQLIADYTGTSREIVTMELNRLRRLSAIGYARAYIDLHKDALAAELRNEGQPSFCPGAGLTHRAAG
jgi:CRP-like cAMP-binding protein